MTCQDINVTLTQRTPITATIQNRVPITVNFGETRTIYDVLNDDEDAEFGLIEFSPRIAPTVVDVDTLVLYMTETGTTPNKELALKIKNEDGEEIIISTTLV